MQNINLAALLQLLHCKTPMEAVHVALEATGSVVLLWHFLTTLIPRATLWLVPWATRAAAGLALWLLANPIAGPILRANKDKIVPLLRQLLDLVNKVAGAFEQELEKDIEAPEPAPAPPATVPGGAPDASKTPSPTPPPAPAAASSTAVPGAAPGAPAP